MDGQRKLVTDADGNITEGRFKGRHVDQVMEYLEHLESAVDEDPEKKAAAPQVPVVKLPAAEELAARSKERISGVEALAQAGAQRAVQDDEEAFAATVRDYDAKFGTTDKSIRTLIGEIRSKTPLAQQMLRGWHKQAYMYLKQQDPKIQAQILGVVAEGEAEPPPDPDVEEAPQVEEPAATAVAEVAKVKIVPKAVPSARPTPAGRVEAKAKERVPKLKADAEGKIGRVAAAMGKSVAAYLLDLEDRGVSQEQLVTMSMKGTSNSSRRKSVYDAV